MKIKPEDALKAVTAQQTQKRTKAPDTKFDEILQKAVESKAASDVHEISVPPSLSVTEVQMEGISAEQQGPVMEKVEQLLDALEDYQNKLGDPRVPPKDLEPIISQLEARNEDLTALVNSLPDGDSMKDFANRVLVTSVVEVEKFRRGDYL